MSDSSQNNSNNVVSLNKFKALKASELDTDYAYTAKILVMDKLELLEEMIRFQEERSAAGGLNPGLMVRGKVLFGALEKVAETQELRLLSRSYRRHLEFELDEHRKKSATQD